ncbi:MAG: DUF3135 domain-containing protein [Gammaproteobacteria bacterium]|nr:DUF3135 domain-containing protein [Gammaproteobacteria bacterium]
MQTAFDWDIDFDRWSELARSDPAAFERQREVLVNQAISRTVVEHQHRLRCLQWRVDKVRERSGTALAACIRISAMMWDAVMGQGGLVDQLEALREAAPAHTFRPYTLPQRASAAKPTGLATVLPFPDKNGVNSRPRLAVEEELP